MKIISRLDHANFRKVSVDSQAFSLRLCGSKFDREAGLELLKKIESWVLVNSMVNSNKMPLLIVDFQEVEFLDSNGLGALLEARSTLRANGSNIALCSLHASVKLVLEITKSDRAFAVFDTFEDFVAHFEASQLSEQMAVA
jgi:anti-anti-sigma factor